jgi:hypothetical protein
LDEVVAGSPNLRQTENAQYPGYDVTWSGDNGIEIRAKVRAYKVLIAARDYTELKGAQRDFKDYGLNVRAKGDVMLYVSRKFKANVTRLP